jgi:hypothetical protein
MPAATAFERMIWQDKAVAKMAWKIAAFQKTRGPLENQGL